jgi:hypothetical protein
LFPYSEDVDFVLNRLEALVSLQFVFFSSFLSTKVRSEHGVDSPTIGTGPDESSIANEIISRRNLI